jgi:hypothetical protein
MAELRLSRYYFSRYLTNCFFGNSIEKRQIFLIGKTKFDITNAYRLGTGGSIFQRSPHTIALVSSQMNNQVH